MNLERNRRLWLAFALGLGAFGLGWLVAVVSGIGGSRDLPELTAARPPTPAVIERGDFRPNSEVPDLYEEITTPVEVAATPVTPVTGSGATAPATSPSTPATGTPPLTADSGGTDVQLP